MKKILLMTLAAAMGAAWAESVTIDAANVVGILPIGGTSYEKDVAMPFTGIAGQPATISELYYTDNREMASTISVRVNNPKYIYSSWIWVTYLNVNALVAESFNDVESDDPTEQEVPYGFGLRLNRKTSAQPWYIMGEVPKTTPALTFQPGTSSFLVNPLDTAIDVESVFKTVTVDGKASGPVDGDRLIVRAGGQDQYYDYSETPNSDGKHWYTYQAVTILNPKNKPVQTTKTFYPLELSIPVGEAFWYVRSGASAYSVQL